MNQPETQQPEWMLTEEDKWVIKRESLDGDSTEPYEDRLLRGQARKLMELLSSCEGAYEIWEEDEAGGTEEYWAIPRDLWRQLRKDLEVSND